MRNWIFGGLVGITITAASSVAAFDGGGSTGGAIGNCTFRSWDLLNQAKVRIFEKTTFTNFYAGGSYWDSNTLKTDKAITVDLIAECLGLASGKITNFTQVGADNSVGYSAQTYMGFTFTIPEGTGYTAGTYEYFIGTSKKTGTIQNESISFVESTSSEPNVGSVVAPTVQADATRYLATQITNTQRLIREGRNRFIQSRRQMRGDNAGISSRNMVDFEFDGALNATNGRISSKGSFFQQDGNFEGTSRRVLFGDFDIQRSGDTGSTTATLSGKLAWERMLTEQNMLGYYIGADVARSNIKGTYFGEQNTYGVSVGTYFVSALQENLFLDGFASLGVGKNNLALANGTVDLSGDYNSRTVTLGAALTGVIKQESYEIWPELAFTYGKTRLGTLSMTDSLAAVADNNVTLDAGDISVANLTLRPEFRLPMDGLATVDSNSLFTFAPRLLCEQVDTTVKTKNCGGGAEFGIDRTSEDGLSRFVARIKADRISKVTRSALELKFEYHF